MRRKQSNAKGLLWLLSIVPTVFVVLGLWARPEARVKVDSTARELPPGVSALGYLEPLGRVIKLSGPASLEPTRIERLLVKEGDTVRTGQVVAILDVFGTKKAAWDESKAHVIEAEDRVAQVRAGAKTGEVQAQQALLAQATAKLANSEEEYERYRQLHDAGVVATEALESRRLEYESSEAEYRREESTLQGIREVRPVDLNLAEAALSSAKAAVTHASADLDLAVLHSPITGQVLKIYSLPGEDIAAKGVMDLGDVSRMCAVAEVYETDVSRLRMGEKARVTIRAINQSLDGEVAEIGHLIGKKDVFGDDPSAAVDARVVEVRVALDEATSQRVVGLTNTRVDVVFVP